MVLKNEPVKVRLDYLDGIRGWAAIIVVLSHVILGVVALDNPDLANKSVLKFITHGHLSVLVFFVLSGYALSASQILSSKRNTELSIIARYFRLTIPILVVSIIAYFFLRLGFFKNIDAASTDEAKQWLGRFYDYPANVVNAIKFSLYDTYFKYDEHGTYNSSLWTMPYEMMGSIFIYSFVSIFRKDGKCNFIITSVLFLYFYFNNPFMFCFLSGYILFELRNFKKDFYHSGLDIMLTLFFAVVVYIDTYHRPVSEQGQSIEAIALVFIVTFSKPFMIFCSNRISLWLGKISFSLYLIQIVIICSWSSFLKINLPYLGYSINENSVIIIFSTLLICVIAARLLSPIDSFSTSASKKIARIILINNK